MKLTLLLSVLLMSSQAIAAGEFVGPLPKPEPRIKVAVIDTGITNDLFAKDFICNRGHMDYTGTGLNDTHGHGSNVASLIDQYAKDMPLEEGFKASVVMDKPADYCMVILKYYDPKQVGRNNLINEIKAFKQAIELNVDVINFSGGGTELSLDEQAVIKEALDKKIIVVVAAGNEQSNTSKKPYYPASLDRRQYIVGNLRHKDFGDLTSTIEQAPTSNYGVEVNSWEFGTDLKGYDGRRMTGTSQATAVKSGKLVKQLLNMK